MKKLTTKQASSKKIKMLIRSIFFDAIGYLSFAIPVIGELSDVIWAPVSAYLIMKMYKGTLGKVGGIIEFIEEGMPGLDFIPTFTLLWIYKYIIKKNV